MNYDVILKVKRMPHEGETMTCESASVSAGGKGANQAVQAAKLGVKTYIIGAVGNDNMGSFLLDEAVNYGLDVSHVKRSAISTGMGCVHALEDGRVFATINRGANQDITVKDIDNAEELWDLYNILEVGDSIRLATSRKVQHDTGSKTTSFKKTITITLKIEDIEFSPNSINIKGKNISENEYIKIGQYQTDEIVVNTTFTLSKNYWDDIHLETLKKITDIRVMSEIVAILMEAGIANLFYITSNQTVSKGKITQSVPKKKAYSKHDVKENEFFNKILNQFIKRLSPELAEIVFGYSSNQNKILLTHHLVFVKYM